MTTRSKPDTRWLLAVGVCALLVILTLQPYSVCPFAVATGIPCPGCGLTRSLVALAQGHIGQAWHFHPLGPAVGVGALVLTLQRLLRVGYRTPLTTYDWLNAPAFLWWGALVVVTSVWLARFCGALGGPAEVHSPLELLQTLNRK